MPSSFLDTTVLIALSESIEPARTNSQAFVNSHQPSEVAFYAMRELLAGRVRYICDAHNVLLATQNPGEAMLALLRRSAAAGRSRETPLKEIAQALDKIFGRGESGSGTDFKREALQDIMIRASQLWRRAKNPKNVKTVQPLACFNSGDVSVGSAGELRGPNNAFNCATKDRCAAAGYLHDDQAALSKLVDALHPNNLDDRAKSKRENQQRRKALKELQSRGPKDFDKRRCRALGDAYFVVMCPQQSVIGTTNLSDFEPLCRALGRVAKRP